MPLSGLMNSANHPFVLGSLSGETLIMPSVNRRHFVEHSTRILAATAACGTLQESHATPLSTLSVGIMGVRGRGRGLATGFAGMPDVEVTY